MIINLAYYNVTLNVRGHQVYVFKHDNKPITSPTSGIYEVTH